MNKTTKITLEELIRRKEQMLESKKKPKTATLYIKSLGGTKMCIRDSRKTACAFKNTHRQNKKAERLMANKKA